MESIDDINEVVDINDSYIKEFEAALQNCLSTLTKQESGAIESSQVKNNVELSIQQFLDSAKRIEKFFIEKRYIMSIEKPEQIEKERLQDMKNEFQQKDNIFRQHRVLLEQWHSTLSRVVAAQYPDNMGGGPPPPAPPAPATGATGATPGDAAAASAQPATGPSSLSTISSMSGIGSLAAAAGVPPLPQGTTADTSFLGAPPGSLMSSTNDLSAFQDIHNIPFM